MARGSTAGMALGLGLLAVGSGSGVAAQGAPPTLRVFAAASMTELVNDLTKRGLLPPKQG